MPSSSCRSRAPPQDSTKWVVRVADAEKHGRVRGLVFMFLDGDVPLFPWVTYLAVAQYSVAPSPEPVQLWYVPDPRRERLKPRKDQGDL